MITIFLDRGNKLTIDYNNSKLIKYIPTKHQLKFIRELFNSNKLMYTDEEGTERKFPVVIHNNINKTTIKLNSEGVGFTELYNGVPKGVKYRPNKLVTYERDRQDWLITRMKRVFNSYDNNTLSEQEFKTEMRTLFAGTY